METFDNIADWHGAAWGEAGGGSATTNNGDLPQLISGGVAQWDYATSTTGGWLATDQPWIATRDAAHTWGNKNLIINYTNLSGTCTADDGLGPSRLGMFTGDGIDSASGYSKVHVFYMMKFHEGYFVRKADDSDWEYRGYNKFFEMATGFTAVRYWGEPAEHQLTCADDLRVGTDYGPNYSLFNIAGGGATYPGLLFAEHGRTALYVADSNNLNGDPGCWRMTNTRSDNYLSGGLDYQDLYTAGEWFGIEYIMDQGTLGNSDGELTVNIYRSDGTLFKTQHQTGLSSLVQFDHRYNKFVLGGNMSISGAACSAENRIYIDDFIIDDNEIALIYFAMLNNQPTIIRADVDQQNGITSTDASLTLRNSLGLNMSTTHWQPSATTGDVNCEGVSTSTDASLILRKFLDLEMSGTGWCVE